jgi:hypothetical protein
MLIRFRTPLFVALALAPAWALQTRVSADDSRDAALHKLHVKSVEQQVAAAEALANGLMDQAAARQLDLTPYVKDARYLADVDPPADPDLAAKLEGSHRDTLDSLESVLGVPGLFGTLRGGGPGPVVDPDPGHGGLGPITAEPPINGCSCQRLVLDAPHDGSSHRTYPLGAAAVSPAPVFDLTADFGSAIAFAGHQVATTGERFHAPAGTRSILASATMNLDTDIGVGGLGVAHGWSDVQFVVTDAATGAEVCRSARLETANLAAGAWYARAITDLGERTLGCSFVRDPAVAANYDASIELRAYGTYAGIVGGHSRVHARFRRIDVALCP